MDENFIQNEKIFEGITARVIQHEYDHIEGVLFTEHLKPIKKAENKKETRKHAHGHCRSGLCHSSKPRTDHFLPKSAGISPHCLVSHLRILVL